MPITVNVVTQDEYDLWLKDAKQKFAKDEKTNIKLAKRIIKEKKLI